MYSDAVIVPTAQQVPISSFVGMGSNPYHISDSFVTMSILSNNGDIECHISK
jgi:hypothetical protein